MCSPMPVFHPSLPFAFKLVFHGGIEPLFKIFEIGGDVHGQIEKDVWKSLFFAMSEYI